MKQDIFDINFSVDQKKYTGSVHPSQEQDKHGNPMSYHVLLNGASFGHLSFNDCKWFVNEDRPDYLVKLVGKEIEKHYRL